MLSINHKKTDMGNETQPEKIRYLRNPKTQLERTNKNGKKNVAGKDGSDSMTHPAKEDTMDHTVRLYTMNAVNITERINTVKHG